MDSVRLGDVASLTEGYKQNMASEYIQSGVPFLRSLNIEPFHINTRDIKYVSQEFSESLRKSILKKNDVLVVRTGKPGTCSVVNESFVGANCSDVIIIRPDTERLDPYYLSIFINTQGKRQVLLNSTGAVQKHFYLHSAKDLVLHLPSLTYQKQISNLGRLLNDEINLNNQINDNLAA